MISNMEVIKSTYGVVANQGFQVPPRLPSLRYLRPLTNVDARGSASGSMLHVARIETLSQPEQSNYLPSQCCAATEQYAIIGSPSDIVISPKSTLDLDARISQ